MSFFAELKRRNVIRMAGLYLVGAWLMTQVAATLLPVFDAPGWVMKALVVLLALGFFAAVVFAWVFELTPDGIKRDAEVPASESIAPQTARRLDRGIIMVLLVALAYFAFDKFVLAPQGQGIKGASVTTTAAPGADSKAISGDSDPQRTDPKSIAVLAFANMSADKDNEYFSDGVSEEILNALAQVRELKVAGRTSSFYFKGRNASLTEIGRTLGVAHVLEGSVRKQGARLRITAQLIRVNDGFHLWSETFDGNDTDIFALQEDIARRVTDELKVALNAGQQSRLVDVGTNNPDAYALYLRASDIFNRRDRTRFPDAITALQRAVQLDAKFARAFARLASMYVVLPSYTDADPQQSNAQVMRYSTEALTLDPGSAEAWAARGGSMRKFRDQQVSGRDAFEQAMRLDPDDVNASFWYGLTLISTGYRSLGTVQIDHALSLDPMLPNALRWRGMLYLQDGDIVRAEPMLQRAYDLGLLNTAGALADVAMLHGDRAASERLFAAGNSGLDFNMSREDLLLVHQGIYGDAAARKAAVQSLQESLTRLGKKRSLPSTPLYLFRLGEPKLGLQVLRERQMGDSIDSMNWLWTPQGSPIRKLPEFNEFLAGFHLPELWDKYGPPDSCRKVADGSYRCE